MAAAESTSNRSGDDPEDDEEEADESVSPWQVWPLAQCLYSICSGLQIR